MWHAISSGDDDILLQKLHQKKHVWCGAAKPAKRSFQPMGNKILKESKYGKDISLAWWWGLIVRREQNKHCYKRKTPLNRTFILSASKKEGYYRKRVRRGKRKARVL